VDFSRDVITATKTKSGRGRDIPMNPDVREALMALRREANGSEYVFSNPHTGTRQKEAKKGFQTALRLAGVEGLRWHDLRATFGARLGEADYDAFTIAELMGHSDIRTTRRYVRATVRNKRAAVEAVMLGLIRPRHNGVANEKQPPKLAAVRR
jgi:integrase